MGHWLCRSVFSVLALAVFLFATASSLQSQTPGMWPFNMIPHDVIEEVYGVELPDWWVERVQFGTVRVNAGGSGSFVSAHGLMSTNHHVARRALEQISTAERNFLETGFLAQSLEDEIPIPDYTVSVLKSITDVTEEMQALYDPSLSASENKKIFERRVAEIEAKAFAENGERVEVVSLFDGLYYHVYRYKLYTDVRLAWAPEEAIGYYGGDEANYQYPRHVIDETFFRVYDESGKPLEVEHFIPWSSGGVSEGDVVFVSGNPGFTDRYMTLAEMIYEQEVQLPFVISSLLRQEANIEAYAARGEEEARQAHDAFFGIRNSLTRMRGMLAAIDKVLDSRRAEEAQLLDATRESHPEIGEAIETIERSVVAHRERRAQAHLVDGLPFDSELWKYAVSLVKHSQEMQKPDLDRSSDYREANYAEWKRKLLADKPVYLELEAAKLASSLEWFYSVLHSGSFESVEIREIEEAIWGQTAIDSLSEGSSTVAQICQARAKELVSGNLHEAGTRDSLLSSDHDALVQSNDPMIQLATKVLPIMDRLEKGILDDENNESHFAKQAIMRFRINENGESLAPDANFTPRFSMGLVEGYIEFGLPLPAQTTIGQIFDQAEARAGEPDWTLPESWIEARDQGRLDLSTPMITVSRTDTTGGNSGSPVIDRHGNRVGIHFDGNRHKSGSERVSNPTGLTRGLMVDCRATMEALVSVYGATFFQRELLEGATPYLN